MDTWRNVSHVSKIKGKKRGKKKEKKWINKEKSQRGEDFLERKRGVCVREGKKKILEREALASL